MVNRPASVMPGRRRAVASPCAGVASSLRYAAVCSGGGDAVSSSCSMAPLIGEPTLPLVPARQRFAVQGFAGEPGDAEHPSTPCILLQTPQTPGAAATGQLDASQSQAQLHGR